MNKSQHQCQNNKSASRAFRATRMNFEKLSTCETIADKFSKTTTCMHLQSVLLAKDLPHVCPFVPFLYLQLMLCFSSTFILKNVLSGFMIFMFHSIKWQFLLFKCWCISWYTHSLRAIQNIQYLVTFIRKTTCYGGPDVSAMVARASLLTQIKPAHQRRALRNAL